MCWHQWYWSYEYSDFEAQLGAINFDSYMIPEDELEVGELRLLEVDNRIVLPVNTHIRVLVTAADVLHSWAVPSLGIKLDACTGRLNQTSVFILREGFLWSFWNLQCGQLICNSCWSGFVNKIHLTFRKINIVSGSNILFHRYLQISFLAFNSIGSVSLQRKVNGSNPLMLKFSMLRKFVLIF